MTTPSALLALPIYTRLSQTYLIVLSSHTSHVRCDAPQVLPRIAITDVSRADNLLDLAWYLSSRPACESQGAVRGAGYPYE